MSDLKTYPVLGPLKHDGALYVPSEDKLVTVDLTETEAGVLRDIGVIGEAVAAPPETKTEPEKQSGTIRTSKPPEPA